MDIILVHIGPDIPPYLGTCIRQIETVSSCRVIVALTHPAGFSNTHKRAEVVDLSAIERTEAWKEFIKIDFFHEDDLWRRSCERLYAIEAVMRSMGLRDALHIENDNLIYGGPHSKWIRAHGAGKLLITHITASLASAGVMYAGSADVLGAILNWINSLMMLGRDKLHVEFGGEMLNEMRLLDIVSKDSSLIDDFPTLPDECPGSAYIYDCASWGQYVGGAHHAPGSPWMEQRHIIGRHLLAGEYGLVWHFGRPYVKVVQTNRAYPLFNLHIHSKELERWATPEQA